VHSGGAAVPNVRVIVRQRTSQGEASFAAAATDQGHFVLTGLFPGDAMARVIEMDLSKPAPRGRRSS